MAKDRMLKNLTGESSCTPASLSRSGNIWTPAFALFSGKSAFSVCLDGEKSPMLGYVMLLRRVLLDLGTLLFISTGFNACAPRVAWKVELNENRHIRAVFLGK